MLPTQDAVIPVFQLREMCGQKCEQEYELMIVRKNLQYCSQSQNVGDKRTA